MSLLTSTPACEEGFTAPMRAPKRKEAFHESRTHNFGDIPVFPLRTTMDTHPLPQDRRIRCSTRARPLKYSPAGIEQVNRWLNMKVPSRFQAIALVLLGLSAFSPSARAQIFGLGVTGSHTSIAVSNSITYSINLTNLTSGNLNAVRVTNAFSGPVIFQNSTTTGTLVTDDQTNYIFELGTLFSVSVNQMTLTVAPMTAGSLTNTVTVGSSTTATATTNIVVLVTNVPLSQADLAVAITGPAGPVLQHDWFTYGVILSNLGPATASGVVLTNLASTNVLLIDFTPTNQPGGITTNGLLWFDVGTLTNGAVRPFSLTVESPNAGVLTLSAFVNDTGTVDPNTNNNTAFTNLLVEALVTNQLIATNVSAMTFNPQNSLMQQTIRVVNVSTSTVASARVIVTGLTNWLYNGVGVNTLGTSNLNPFVVYAAPLDPGQSADLLLQYVVPNRLPFPVDNSNYIAAATSAVNLSVPALPTLALTNFFLSDGSMLVEFPATVGKTYQIQYSSDATFNTGVLLAQPPIQAQADRVQWIDSGPPNTVSLPMSVPMRFYRVQLIP